MTYDKLLRYVATHDVRLSDADGALSYDAPTDAVTSDVLDALRRHKARLLERLARPADRGPLSYQQERMMSVVARAARPGCGTSRCGCR